MWKRCTPSSARTADPSAGFSLLEVLVALTLTLVVMGAALTLAMAGRRLYISDQGRTDLNQNLRIGLDLLGIDIRQAGERLPADLPVVEIVDGISGAPDELVLRRNLLDTMLPLCQDMLSGSSSSDVFVAAAMTPPPGCAVAADGNADGWPDNIEAFRTYRIANGGVATAYLYNPVSGNGQYFEFDGENNSSYKLDRLSGGSWSYDFLVADGSRVYILERRTYRLSGDLLQYVDGNTGDVRNLIHRVTDFQAVAHLEDGTSQTTFDGSDDWTELVSVEVSLTGQVDIGQGRTLHRELSARFLPRNVLSF